jgi:hypothetical protein
VVAGLGRGDEDDFRQLDRGGLQGFWHIRVCERDVLHAEILREVYRRFAVEHREDGVESPREAMDMVDEVRAVERVWGSDVL